MSAKRALNVSVLDEKQRVNLANALWKTRLWFEPRGCTNDTSTEVLHLFPLNGGLRAPSAGIGALESEAL